MSEHSELTVTESVVSRENKVYHFGDIDAVIPLRNNSRQNYEAMLELVTRVGEGTVPDLDPAGNRQGAKRHFLLPSVESEPGIFVKQKKSSGLTEKQNQPYLDRRNIPKEEITEKDSQILRGMNAHHSILNELALASEVSELFRKDEFRSIVKESGFSDICLSAPLFAVVNRVAEDGLNQKQYVAYENIEGAQTVVDLERDPKDLAKDPQEIIDMIKKVCAEVRGYLEANGFDFNFSDFQEAQFIYDSNTNKLYVIDIEGWHKLPRVVTS